ncbi:MAG: hypothetical protein EBT06_05160 [Gammaproteobacteria bacterium]|nr:hypothetical protein [Gammaproteobacteria bacterium]NBT44303.1 hypothetical protein [Gammaproteobacteria bacterium]NBY22863.1 hypothetical protein [Gammaproteobacteria bacterium]NDE34253.1 hypothetical protein [Gammaproteobacteria bacterium]NDE56311.1 hypothetical protein [Gammaproteobacteria bacterium]
MPFLRSSFAIMAMNLILLGSFFLVGPVSAKPKGTSTQTTTESPKTGPLINDFPTQARVESVMQCMAEHGGSNLDNMYHCVCAIDKIASLMNFKDYSESLTFTYMFDTPGDKGGEFRDPPQSKILRDRLKAAREESQACFPKLPAP